MTVLQDFLNSEVECFYEDLISFISSYEIRSGEFECNVYILKKMDRKNFIIYMEDIYSDNHRGISDCICVYAQNLLDSINEYAKTNNYYQKH